MHKGTQAELVKELGCSRTAISKLVQAKDYRIIYLNGGKRIDIKKSYDALVDSGFGKRSKPIKKKTKSAPGKAGIPTHKEHQEDIDRGGALTLEDSRERIEKHKAFHQSEKERINNEIKMEKMIDVVEVGDRSFNLWRQVRESIQSIKDRCAIKIRAAESDHEAEQILNDETHRILSSIVANYDNLDDEALKKKLAQRLIK
jgi:hypothetical protein